MRNETSFKQTRGKPETVNDNRGNPGVPNGRRAMSTVSDRDLPDVIQLLRTGKLVALVPPKSLNLKAGKSVNHSSFHSGDM